MKTKSKFKALIAIVMLLGITQLLFACNNGAYPDSGGTTSKDYPWFWRVDCEYSETGYDIDEVKVNLSLCHVVDEIGAVIENYRVRVLPGSITHRAIIGDYITVKESDVAISNDTDRVFELGEVTIPKEALIFNYGFFHIFCDGQATVTKMANGFPKEDGERYQDGEQVSESMSAECHTLYYSIKDGKVFLSENQKSENTKQKFTGYGRFPLSVKSESPKNDVPAVDFIEVNAPNALFNTENVNIQVSVGRMFDDAPELPEVFLIFRSDSLYIHNGIWIFPEKEPVGMALELKYYNRENFACNTIANADGSEKTEYSYTKNIKIPGNLFEFPEDAPGIFTIELYSEDPRENADAEVLAKTEVNYCTLNGQTFLW